MRSHIFAQLERDLIKARTTEGREEAKARQTHGQIACFIRQTSERII